MESGLKALLLAAGTVITCIVISLAFYITRGSRDTATSAFSNISKINSEFNESDKVMYDGLSVAGSEVINAINKFKNDEMGIMVVTKKSTNYYGYSLSASDNTYSLSSKSNASINDAKKVTSSSYINQNAQFIGEVLRDSNYTIIGIKFTQQ